MALLLVLSVLVIGSVGYWMFGFSLVDSIYMTIITVSTVGFKEVEPLGQNEKIFTSILILSSIFIVGYAIKVITENIISRNNIVNLRRKRVQSKIQLLKDHIIVCGFGRNGRQAVLKLKNYNKDFVVIESNEEVIDDHRGDGILFLDGDATQDEVLNLAGIERASTLISALPSDADNLFIVLSARQLNPHLKIISRATEETSYQKLKLAGADNVILPDKIGGDHMASLVVVPDLVEFLDNLSVSGEDDSINVEQIPFEKVCPSGEELTIRDLDLRRKTGCSIIGYKTPGGEYIVNPDPSLKLEQGSKLIVIGRPNQIESLKQQYEV
ncbi:potassium channel family protein [Aureitalea marina]|nr:potassium channel protein [Aureitalea marina]